MFRNRNGKNGKNREEIPAANGRIDGGRSWSSIEDPLKKKSGAAAATAGDTERGKNSARKRRKKKKSGRTGLIILLLIALIAGVAACSIAGGDKPSSGDDSEGAGSLFQKEEPVDISILCVGDVMAHSPNLKAALNLGGGNSYVFTEDYHWVNWYIKGVDLAMCNVETTFSGGTPSGYPLFSAPDELAYALSDAGFDVAITSNNHMMDTGFDGMQRTLEVLRNQGMTTVGSRYAGEPSWSMREVNGLKIGLVGYTYETTGAGASSISINGNYVSREAEELINSFNYHEIDADLEKICADIDAAKAAGVNLVLCYMHWGNEYQRQPDANQTYMAQYLADRGADVIFASHPHVLQTVNVLNSADGRTVPVFYSMGNFISNQRAETLQNRYTEQGMMARVDIRYMKSTGEILREKIRVIPTWVDRYGSPLRYSIIPLDADLAANPVLASSGHLSRAQQALADVTELIGQEYLDGKVIIEKNESEEEGSEGEASGAEEAAA